MVMKASVVVMALITLLLVTTIGERLTGAAPRSPAQAQSRSAEPDTDADASPDEGSEDGTAGADASQDDGAPARRRRPPRSERIKFVLAGSRAAEAADAVAITPGLMVQSDKGDPIGKVERMIANNKGRVTSLLVNMGDRSAMVPAMYFKRQGDHLVSSMSAADIRKAISDEGGAEPPSEAGRP